MSGAVSLARFKILNSSSELMDAQIRVGLGIAQAVAESISGLAFGSEVAGTITNISTVYKLPFYGGMYEVGQSVRLIGGGVSASPFVVIDTGVNADGSLWITVNSTVSIAPTKILPVVEYVGTASSGYVNVDKRPVFSVVSVKVKSGNSLWSDTSVITLASTTYEVFQERGINRGVYVLPGSLPTVAEGGRYLVKRMVRQQVDGVKITYAAGFYSQVPADIEGAICQLVVAISGSIKSGGAFASESHDYYSYQLLSYEQLAMLPFAAISVLKSYGRR